MGFVKDKRTFLTLMFMKRTIQNMFDEHLNLMVCMFAQFFLYVNIFIYDSAITTWIEDEAKKGFFG
jgi:hypothetical protein